MTKSPPSEDPVELGAGLRVLFHRPTPWDSEIHCSTKALAEMFHAEGHRVSYLEDLVDPIDVLRGRYSLLSPSPSAVLRDGVHVVRSFTPVPIRDVPGLRGASAISWSYRLASPALRDLVTAVLGGAPDLIWTTRPGSSCLQDLFPEATLVFHVIDNYSAYRGEYIKEVERRDYARADIVFAIGHVLADYVTDELGVPQKKVHVLGQGVAAEGYQSPLPEPDDLHGLPRPRAVWVGVTGKLDAELLRIVVDTVQEAGGSVVIVGPPSAKLDGVLERPGVHYLGPRRSPEVPAILQHCDIGLLTYELSRREVYRGQNPLKLYEYAAAGLSIVSTPHDEYAHIEPPVVLTGSPAETAGAVRSALDRREELGEAARGFAGRFSWKRLQGRAMDILRLGGYLKRGRT